MHIMLTNDDGYQAEGLRQLARALIEGGHRVSVAAPDRERSAVSHGISITTPLRTRCIELEGAKGWAIDGTPADCARLGLFLLKNDKPDMCISGINKGGNMGGACIYSGTVNSALEASMAGCPAIATSLNSFASDDYTAAARVTLKLAEWAKAHPLPRGEIYNLNSPSGSDIKGVYFTQTMAPEFLTDANYQEFESDYHVKYYFLDDGAGETPYPSDSDAVKCAEGWATLSVLGWDMSAKPRTDMPACGPINL